MIETFFCSRHVFRDFLEHKNLFLGSCVRTVTHHSQLSASTMLLPLFSAVFRQIADQELTLDVIIYACDKLPILRYASSRAIAELVAEHAQDECDRHSCKRRAEKSAEASPSVADTRGRMV